MHTTTAPAATAAPSSAPLASPPISPPPPGPASAPVGLPRARARDLGLALLGLLALGGAAALGLPPSSAALRLAPSVILVDLAALALTAPALIAAHQYLRLEAEPEQLAAGLGQALVHGGRVAGGLAVVVLFFSATTELAGPLLLLSLLAVGVFTSATACVELGRAERHASASDPAPRFALLVLGWLVLAWMIALRVGVDVGAWVLDLGRGF